MSPKIILDLTNFQYFIDKKVKSIYNFAQQAAFGIVLSSAVVLGSKLTERSPFSIDIKEDQSKMRSLKETLKSTLVSKRSRGVFDIHWNAPCS